LKPVSTSRRSPWSWTALALWLGKSLLAAGIAVSMLFGPELADRAWDQGVHVTPAQAAMHFALIAQGFTHHHGQTAKAVSHGTGAGGPVVEASSPPPDWGTPFAQIVQLPLRGWPGLLAGMLPSSGQLRPASLDLAPPAPPPRLVS
jgi:hypothetical protein